MNPFFTEWSSQTSGTATSCAVPASGPHGDFVIAFVRTAGVVTHAWSGAPWTKGGQFTVNGTDTISWGYTFYGVGGDATVSWGSSRAFNQNNFRYRGVNQATSVGNSSSNSGTTTAITGSSINYATNSTVLTFIHTTGGSLGALTDSSGLTPRAGGTGVVALLDKAYTDAGSTGGVSLTSTNATTWGLLHIELKEQNTLPLAIYGLNLSYPIVGPFKSTGAFVGNPSEAGGLGEPFGASANVSAVAQSFATPGASHGRSIFDSVILKISKNGSPTDNVVVDIKTNPSGTTYATSNPVSGTTLTGSYVETTFTFPANTVIQDGVTLYLVARRTGSPDAGNYYNLSGSTTSQYSGGGVHRMTGGAWDAGPSASDDLYFSVVIEPCYFIFGTSVQSGGNVRVLKALDPTSQFWPTVDFALGGATNIPGVSAIQAGDTIHLGLHTVGTVASSHDIWYVPFSLATLPAAPPLENIVTAADVRDSTLAEVFGVSICLQNNQPTIAYNGPRVSNMGNSYAQIYEKHRTGTNTWAGGASPISAGGQNNFFNPAIVTGSSNRAHIFWTGAVNANNIHRHLTSAYVVGTESTLNLTAGAADRVAVSYDDGGTQRVVVTAQQRPAYFNSADNPTQNLATTFLGTNSGAPARLFSDGGTAWSLYRNTSDSDIYASSSTDDGNNWTTGTSAHVGTVAVGVEGLSRNATIYQRGNDVVIPFAVNDNGVLEYNEYVVRSLGPPPLTASNLTVSSPAIGAPALTTSYAFVGGLVVGSPALGAAVLSIKQTLSAGNLTVGSPAIGTSALLQTFVLAAGPLTVSALAIGTSPLVQKHVFVGGLTVGSPAIGAPAITQQHALAAGALTVSALSLGAPAFAQSSILSAAALTVSALAIGTQPLKQTHALAAGALTVGALSIGTSALVQTHALVAGPLTVGALSLGAPALTLNSATLTAGNLTTGSPIIGTAAMAAAGALLPGALTVSSPVIGAGVFAQTHALAAGSITTGSPAIGTSALIKVLATPGLTVGALEIGTSPLVKPLATANFATGPPAIGAGIFVQNYVFVGGLTVGSPTIGTAGLGAAGALLPGSLTVGSPILGAPALTTAYTLTAAALTVSSPAIGTSAVVQKHTLVAGNLTVSSPAIGTSPLVQTHAFVGGLTLSSPAIGTSALVQTNVLSAGALTVSSPAIGAPAISQRHTFVAGSLTTSSPVIGTAALGAAGAMFAGNLTVSSPAIGAPSLGLILAAGNLTVGSPVIGTSPLAKAFATPGLTAGSPAIGAPAISQRHVFVGGLTVGSPVIGAGVFGGLSALSPASLTVSSPSIGTSALRKALFTAGLTVGSPSIGTAALIRAALGFLESTEVADKAAFVAIIEGIDTLVAVEQPDGARFTEGKFQVIDGGMVGKLPNYAFTGQCKPVELIGVRQ